MNVEEAKHQVTAVPFSKVFFKVFFQFADSQKKVSFLNTFKKLKFFSL